jgi:hypothetical protein
MMPGKNISYMDVQKIREAPVISSLMNEYIHPYFVY